MEKEKDDEIIQMIMDQEKKWIQSLYSNHQEPN
jgi:hypothetical protein